MQLGHGQWMSAKQHIIGMLWSESQDIHGHSWHKDWPLESAQKEALGPPKHSAMLHRIRTKLTKLLNTESKQTMKAKWRALPPWKWALWNSAKPRQWCSIFVNAQKKGRWPMVNDFKDLHIEILLCGKASSVISWGYPPEMQSAKIPCWIHPPILQFQRVENRCNLWKSCSCISKKLSRQCCQLDKKISKNSSLQYNGFAATSNDIHFDMLWAAHRNNWVPDGTLGAQVETVLSCLTQRNQGFFLKL